MLNQYADFPSQKLDYKLGNIFHVNGVKVRSNAETTKDLQKGAYIINNKKVVVK